MDCQASPAVDPAFRIALFNSSHFCVPLEVLDNLLTLRGDCSARPPHVPSPSLGPPRPWRWDVRRARPWRRHRPRDATKPGKARPHRGGSGASDGTQRSGVSQSRPLPRPQMLPASAHLSPPGAPRCPRTAPRCGARSGLGYARGLWGDGPLPAHGGDRRQASGPLAPFSPSRQDALAWRWALSQRRAA
jgi:hypothetical protein